MRNSKTSFLLLVLCSLISASFAEAKERKPAADGYYGAVLDGKSARLLKHFRPPTPPQVIAELDKCSEEDNGATLCIQSGGQRPYYGVTFLGNSALARKYFAAPKRPESLATMICDDEGTQCWERK